MKARQRYRRFVLGLLFLSAAGLGYCSYYLLCSQIPDRMQVSEEGELPVLFHNGFDTLISADFDSLEAARETTLLDTSGSIGAEAAEVSQSYEVSYSLFGKIPLKTVQVDVVPRKEVYAGGKPIGIYLQTDGVLVVETGKVTAEDGNECCPSEHIIKSGDYIQAVNGHTVSTKEELISCISQCSGNDIIFDVDRDGESVSLKIHPVLDKDGEYKAGIWVRNDTQGIGTLTYVDENGSFGALGHGISDIDTGKLLDIRGGDLYNADVVSVVKGRQGTPGEISGIIHYSEGYKIGEIRENRKNGIYGTVVGFPQMAENMTLYETAYKQEVTPGEASILCSADGTCREYTVEICEIRLNGNDVNKGMILKVTDPDLLSLTGGIVQGMSGSPIIQDGKLVGAVTHVLVNDPTRGYGIFIENMLDAVG